MVENNDYHEVLSEKLAMTNDENGLSNSLNDDFFYTLTIFNIIEIEQNLF